MKRSRKLWGMVIGGVLFILIALAGCSRGEPKQGEEWVPVPEETLAGLESFYSEAPFSILEQPWVELKERQSTLNWWMASDYRGDLFREEGGDWNLYPQTCTDGKRFYVYRERYLMSTQQPDQPEDIQRYLTILDPETMETEKICLGEPEELSGEIYSITGLDCADGRIMLFYQCWGKEGSLKDYYAVEYKRDHSFGEPVSLLTAVEEYYGELKENYIYNDWKWDIRGYFYLCGLDQGRLFVVDEKGNILECIQGLSENRETIKCKYKTPEGVCIWEAENTTTRTLTHFYYGEKGVQVLVQDPFELVNVRCVNERGELYSVNGDAIQCRNLANGENARICLGSNESFQSCLGIVATSKGELVLLIQENGELTISVYSKGGPARQVELTVYCDYFPDYILSSHLKEFSRTHPGVKFQVVERDYQADTEESHWNKLLAQLSAGDGPELLLIEPEHMRILQEKGVLADLSQVLSEETKAQVLPGVFENGSVDGKIYNLAYGVRYETLMIADSLWGGDTWTVEDALNVLDQARAGKNPPIYFLRGRWYQGEGGEEPMSLLLNDFLFDLENSPFLNLGEGTCDFESALFIRLLKTCKDFGREVDWENSPVIDDAQAWEAVKEGEAIAYHCRGAGSLMDFSKDMRQAGGTYHIVGFPTGSGNGSCLKCCSGLSVNAKAQNRDIIDELLQSLYDKRVQLQLSNTYGTVRMDVIQENVREKVDWSDQAYLYGGNGYYYELVQKPEGGTYLQEYLDFLGNCRAMPETPVEILDIIEQESESYFFGDKSAEEVARIIQTRVKLYMDEQWREQ